ncbi:MAG: hypothetical protein M3Y09_01270 [Actinomycetota bacterium]|nr:hypothetical protein [Actinomycetota bacterium]
MRRSSTALIAIIVSGALAVVAQAAVSPNVKLASTSIGKILVNGKGFTVYAFSKDRRNTDVCKTKSGCTMTWPPLTTSAGVTVGSGLNARLLGTIKLSTGVKQVTYSGHPLYRYSFDSSRAATDYVGARQFGGQWDALNAAGRPVK